MEEWLQDAKRRRVEVEVEADDKEPEEPKLKLKMFESVTNIGKGCEVVIIKLARHKALIDRVVDSAVVKFGLECRPPVTVFGRACRQRRDVGFFASSPKIKGYAFSNQVAKTTVMDAPMLELLQIVNDLYGADFNGMLINRYPGKGEKWGDGTLCEGDSCIGEHGDDEKGLSGDVGVVAISIGAERIFRVRDKETKAKWDFKTKPYTALQMKGASFQTQFVHSIPVGKKIRTTRISITFRSHQLD